MQPTRKLWRWLAIVFVASFAVLLRRPQRAAAVPAAEPRGAD